MAGNPVLGHFNHRRGARAKKKAVIKRVEFPESEWGQEAQNEKEQNLSADVRVERKPGHQRQRYYFGGERCQEHNRPSRANYGAEHVDGRG